MIEEVKVEHIEDWVILTGPEGGRLAKINPESAIKLANELFDNAEKALRATDQLNEYE